ncbi:hypothetical protein KFE25_010051 [Diacronema lutheri]|uniref:Calpain catalytic domain-containing protein n=2 Tax=Diacronema lutheri TaxID=2081491 RepID=A0A8J5XHZ7_DIALT|nr:hypothetical protein KFE25_010051 [Diacronema lutheri]
MECTPPDAGAGSSSQVPLTGPASGVVRNEPIQPRAECIDNDEPLLAVDRVGRHGPAAMVCALVVATVTFAFALAVPVHIPWQPSLIEHVGSGSGVGAWSTPGAPLFDGARVGGAPAEAAAQAADAGGAPPSAVQFGGARGRSRRRGQLPPPTPAAPDAGAQPAPLDTGTPFVPPPAALGATIADLFQPSCAMCASTCSQLSTAFCCSRGCVSRCPYTMHSAGCALPADDDWRHAPMAAECALATPCAGGARPASSDDAQAGARDGGWASGVLGGIGLPLSSADCTVDQSPSAVHSSRALVTLLDAMCASSVDAAAGWRGVAGLSHSARVEDACARARDEDGPAGGCALKQRVDFVLCATSGARFGLCCNQLAHDGAARCVRPLASRVQLGLLAAAIALGGIAVLFAVFFGRIALCWGRALLNPRQRPLALAACAVCCGCLIVRRLARCARARCPACVECRCCDGTDGTRDYAKAGAPRARWPWQARRRAGGSTVAASDSTALRRLSASLSAADATHEVARPRAGEGVALLLVCGAFAACSLVFWHMRYDLTGPPSGASRCAQSCAQALGAEACDARAVSSAAPLCLSAQYLLDGGGGGGRHGGGRRGGGGTRLSEWSCVCEFAPFFRCHVTNSTWAEPAAAAARVARRGAERTSTLATGVCVIDRAHVAWGGAVALGALAASIALLVLGCQIAAHACCERRPMREPGFDELRPPRVHRRGLNPMHAPSAAATAGGASAVRCPVSADPTLALRPRPCDAEWACANAAGKLLNVLLLPLLLPWNALSIYLLPCALAYARRCTELLCTPCRAAWPESALFRFADADFPPNARSLGDDRPGASWALASELALFAPKHARADKNARARRERPCLFNRGPDASDVDQGSLGDCWLMSAFACAAEVDGLIQSLFVTREFSARGKYVVRLYDGNAARWTHVTIDEWVPAQGRKPAYAQPAGNELWVMLLEKAFAKHVGSYAKLHGGRTMWALHAITGDHCFAVYRQQDGSWQPNGVRYRGSAQDRTRIVETRTESAYTADELFERVLQYFRKGGIIAAGKFNSAGTEVQDDAAGVVSGHAYSVLAVDRLTSFPSGRTFRLVKMRNPWGTFAWRGAWADSSKEWAAYPDLRERLFPLGSAGAGELGHDGLADAGTFFMSWDDFVLTWDHLEICDRSTGVRDLALDLNEEDGCIGPTIGCMLGCSWYWFCCRGVAALSCKHASQQGPDELEGAVASCLRGIPHCCSSYSNACMRTCCHRAAA